MRGLEESIRQNTERLTQLEGDLSSGDARRKEAEGALSQTQNQLNQAQEQVTSANNIIAGFALRQSSRGKRLEEISQNLRELTGKRDSVAARTRVFRAMERDFESYQKSVRMVMHEAEHGKLSGIHCPVSRLIRAEDEYTVAIEIGLGAASSKLWWAARRTAKRRLTF